MLYRTRTQQCTSHGNIVQVLERFALARGSLERVQLLREHKHVECCAFACSCSNFGASTGQRGDGSCVSDSCVGENQCGDGGVLDYQKGVDSGQDGSDIGDSGGFSSEGSGSSGDSFRCSDGMAPPALLHHDLDTPHTHRVRCRKPENCPNYYTRCKTCLF